MKEIPIGKGKKVREMNNCDRWRTKIQVLIHRETCPLWEISGTNCSK